MKSIRRGTIIALILSVFLTGCLKSREQKINEQLELGQKYLLEEHYEEAIVAFTKVIQLEEKEFQAYIGLAEAYTGAGNREQAQATLDQGLRVADTLAEEEKTEDIMQYIEEIQALAKQLEAEGKMEELYYEDIQNLTKYLGEHEGEIPEEMLVGEGFQELAESLNEPFITEYNGKYIGIYPNGYIYYGDMENGVREGYGIWFNQNPLTSDHGTYSSYYLFEGAWKDDYPNGKGIEINHIFGTPEDMIPYTKTDGEYKDGYLDGQTMKWTLRNDGTKRTYSFTTVYGKPVFIEDENANGEKSRLLARSAEDENHGLYAEEDTLFFVHGAKKKDS